jgi:hypothetical protein
MVLSGEFDPKSCPLISYSKLHERSINASSPVKRSMGCRCKNGVCGKACGCNQKESVATVDALVTVIAANEVTG